ncbi:MAG TPA: histidine kinase [Balneolaceae bacterium]|nr:histidine kinase [Balneolaceae bacterium]
MAFRKKIKSFFGVEYRILLLLWFIYLIIPYLVIPERYGYSMAPSDLAIKVYYLLLVVLNNFVLIPRFLNNNKYWKFTIAILSLIVIGAFFEEMVLENIFYPNTRGGSLTVRSVQWSIYKIGFVIALFSSFKLIWDNQKRQKRLSELEREKMESELKFLKSQINPHVLFNNLNNIYSYALEKSEKVPEMLLKLSDIMRYMLKDGNDRFVSLDKELNYLKDFIDLQKLRLEGRGEVKFEVEGYATPYRIAPLLLVAFVENSFKHSMRSEVDNILIKINIRIANDTLHLYVENTYWDNGNDSYKNSQNAETGIGLKNVRKRLELMYPDKHNLEIERENGRFVVQLSLNLIVDELEVHNY